MSDYGSISGEVLTEVRRSIEKHGQQRHVPLGTGPYTYPLDTYRVSPDGDQEPGLWPGLFATSLARLATLDTKAHSQNEGGDGTVTWWHILREEVLEASAEDDPDKLRAEMVQVAAVALKIIDAIDHPEVIP